MINTNNFKDEDPYVRKTAAVSVAKLHDINAGLVEEQGFLDSLKVPELFLSLFFWIRFLKNHLLIISLYLFLSHYFYITS